MSHFQTLNDVDGGTDWLYNDDGGPGGGIWNLKKKNSKRRSEADEQRMCSKASLIYGGVFR